MKKFLPVLLSLVCVVLLFSACTKKDPQGSETCEHKWELTSFVTEETDVPFAAVFSCAECQKEEIRSFSYADIEIPLIAVKGDLSPIYEKEDSLSKEEKVQAEFSYQSKTLSFNTIASFAYQGKSTSDDPKKNYSVNILDSETGKKQEVTFLETWGAGSKYVLKANYIDPSAGRNIVLANLYGQIARDRKSDDAFSSLVNGGAVDGYPVLFYLNGKYQGLYNWDIRKDKWLYGMGDETAGEAVICGSAVDEFENEGGVTIPDEGMRSAKSWKYEYVNESFGEEGWALDSFNAMISAWKSASAEALRECIAEYTILDRTIDVVLFSLVLGNADNVSGNQVWCTYDGKKWTPVPYDLDRSLGRDGEPMLEPDIPLTDELEVNLLYRLVYQAYYDEMKARYFTLREHIFTAENVMAIFAEKLRGVDDRYFLAEAEKWKDADWHMSENAAEITGLQKELDFIEDYLKARFAYCDAFFAGQAAA